MTRREFCEELKKYKDTASVKVADVIPIIFQLGKMRLERVEAGAEDFHMTDALLYLQMCRACLHLMCYDDAWVETIEELGKAIKDERKASEMSIIDLAKKSHVSSTIISALEHGKCNLKVDSFLKIADALQLGIEIE